MGKGETDVYQSPKQEESDIIGSQALLSMFGGQPVSPSPAMNAYFVAESLGGDYDPDQNQINLPDGTKLRFDVLANQFADVTPERSGGQYDRVYDVASGRFVDRPQAQAPSSVWANRANEILKTQVEPNVYGPDSALNLFGKESFGATVYDPTTGRMVPKSEAPPQLTGDYYLNRFGDYLNQPYTPFEYQPFEYTSPTIPTVEPVNEALTNKMISQATDQIYGGGREKRQALESFLAESGGSLGSGRAFRMGQDISEETGREASMAADKIRHESALRSFYDAQSVRDQQTRQNMGVQTQRGEESRYGQGVKREEKRAAFDIGQGQGEKKLAIASAADEAQANRAAASEQANREMSLKRIQALQDMLRIYAGQDATAGQLAATQSGQAMGALSSLFGAAATPFTGAFGKKTTP